MAVGRTFLLTALTDKNVRHTAESDIVIRGTGYWVSFGVLNVVAFQLFAAAGGKAG